MRRFPIIAVLTAIAVGLGMGGDRHAWAAEPVSGGAVSGRVLNADGAPVKAVCVFIAPQDSGIPLETKTKRPFTEEFIAGRETMDLAFALTDVEGRFRFEGVPAGQYRLVAQSWKGTEKLKGLLEVNGEEIQLHGVAEHIKVVASQTSDVVVRPLGTGALVIDQQCGNDETLLLLSTAPPRADPILGFVGWGGPFLQHLIGGNRMPRGKTRVSGLPEGMLHLIVFSADNSPGFGASQVAIKPGATATAYAPFVAGWSDGQHDPPERLVPLFKEVQALVVDKKLSEDQLYKAAGIKPEMQQKRFEAERTLAQHLDDEFVLPGGRKARLADVVAAMAYVRMQEALRQRVENAARKTGQQQNPPAKPGAYEDSFRALHDELGRNYPCFKLKAIDWKAVGGEFLPKVKQLKSDDEFGRLVLELVARLEDSHAAVEPAARQLPRIEFPRWDPGFACLIDDRGRPVVYHVDRSGPAEVAGVKIGMTLLSIRGTPAQKAIEDYAKELARSSGYSSDRYLKYDAARFFVRQAQRGADVPLVLETVEGEKRELSVPATMNVRYLPRLPVPIPGIADSGEVSWTRLEGNLGYLYVRRIGAQLIPLLDRAVGELKDARGLIIDVRGNSGGGFDAERSHRNFAPDDPAEPERPRFRGPMALLLDSRTISAGEGWASWFVAKKRARSFGETTAGASSRKTTYTLPNGYYRVTYPVKAYTGFLDRPIERRGLEPDVQVLPNARDLAAGRDTVLEAAKRAVGSGQ